MVSPSMYVSQEDPDGVLLHYRTTRNGFCPYLIGKEENGLLTLFREWPAPWRNAIILNGP